MKTKTLITGATLALGSTLLTASESESKYIGLQLWSVRDAMREAPRETIEKIGAMGYRFIEAAGYSDGKFYGMEPEEFTALLNENGLDFIASHTGQDVPDQENWDRVMSWWDEALDAHKRAGVKYVIQPWMGQSGLSSLEGLQAYCEYFEAVGAKAREKGLVFGFHNHAVEFESVDGQVIFDYMLENLDPEKVVFELDLYWVVVAGKDPVDYFERYPGRFPLWHVKDEAELGGKGTMMDFERIFSYREKSGVKYLIVEVEKYHYDPIKSVEKSLQFLLNAPFLK